MRSRAMIVVGAPSGICRVTSKNLAKAAQDTVDDVATRIKRRMAAATGDYPTYKSLADRLDKPD